MDFSASAATKDAARLRRRRFCTPPRFFSTLPHTADGRSPGPGVRRLYRSQARHIPVPRDRQQQRRRLERGGCLRGIVIARRGTRLGPF